MKKLFKKKYLKIFVWLTLILISVLIWKYCYEYYKYEVNVTEEELKKREIDKYNFEQLEKVKNILKWLDKSRYISSLKEFNKKFNQDIQPIKNCYYVVSTNYFDEYEWNSKYIFWFELHSDKYKNKYWKEDEYWIFYYAYPKYDLPYSKICFWSKDSCTDFTYSRFAKKISNPCND